MTKSIISNVTDTRRLLTLFGAKQQRYILLFSFMSSAFILWNDSSRFCTFCWSGFFDNKFVDKFFGHWIILFHQFFGNSDPVANKNFRWIKTGIGLSKFFPILQISSVPRSYNGQTFTRIFNNMNICSFWV